mmetsp:Transcript_6614/g.17747  ORF Transcript_6614/g.17747 Transcript_6614/m.17747 type:complete len:345 (-) Transcript_6614:310-1344(-)
MQAVMPLSCPGSRDQIESFAACEINKGGNVRCSRSHRDLGVLLRLDWCLDLEREDRVEEEGEQRSDAVGRLQDDDQAVAPHLLRLVVLEAAQSVLPHAVLGLDHLGHRRRVHAPDHGAVGSGDAGDAGGESDAANGARGRRHRPRLLGEDLADVPGGPDADRVLEVEAVVAGDTAALGPGGQGGHAEAEAQRDRHDEPVAPGPDAVTGGIDVDAGDQDVGEEEGGHAAQDAVRDRGDEGAELGEAAPDDEPDGARHPRGPGGAAGDGDDAVVLRESGVRGRRHEDREDAVHAVRQDAALDPRVRVLVLDGEPRNVEGRLDVSDRLHRGDDEGDQQRNEGGGVEA